MADFVSADACAAGSGNALTRLADGLTRDRSTQYGHGAALGPPSSADQRRMQREQALLRDEHLPTQAQALPYQQQQHHQRQQHHHQQQHYSRLNQQQQQQQHFHSDFEEAFSDIAGFRGLRLVDDFEQQLHGGSVPREFSEAYGASTYRSPSASTLDRPLPLTRTDMRGSEKLSRAGHLAHMQRPYGMPAMLMGSSMGNWAGSRQQLMAADDAKYLRPAPAIDDNAQFSSPSRAHGWVDEFEGPKSETSSSTPAVDGELDEERFREMARRAAAVPGGEKYQRSQFRQMMEGFASGDLSLSDTDVVENRAAAAAQRKTEIDDADWATQFGRDRSRVTELDDIADADGFIDPAKWAARVEQRLHDGEPWAEEFAQERAAGLFGESEAAEREWMQAYKQSMNEWTESYDDAGGVVSELYRFAPEGQNPYISHADPFEQGKILFEQGRIHQAIMAFEAALKKNDQHAECWRRLGQAHAENDKDGKAISALTRSVTVAEKNGEQPDPEALMLLAVSYTNDLYREQALEELVRWLLASGVPEYASLVPETFTNKPRGGMFSDGAPFEAHHQAVSNLFIQAARMRPSEPDADVQGALGLLFNISQEYPKAVDCFKTALNVRPTDYMLWNKLGATLANSNSSQEALGCYQKALSARPTFVRARSNLGISFMALREYEKAATYFLGALSMHPEATHIWNHLQMVLMALGRDDLVQKALGGNVESFRNDFVF